MLQAGQCMAHTSQCHPGGRNGAPAVHSCVTRCLPEWTQNLDVSSLFAGPGQDGSDHCLHRRHAVSSAWRSAYGPSGSHDLPATDSNVKPPLQSCLCCISALGVGKPALVVVPLSTLPNWMAELATWAPHLNAVALHGNDAARKAVKKHELYAPLPLGTGRATQASLQVAFTLHA
jgi:SNF2-related domain